MAGDGRCPRCHELYAADLMHRAGIIPFEEGELCRVCERATRSLRERIISSFMGGWYSQEGACAWLFWVHELRNLIAYGMPPSLTLDSRFRKTAARHSMVCDVYGILQPVGECLVCGSDCPFQSLRGFDLRQRRARRPA